LLTAATLIPFDSAVVAMPHLEAIDDIKRRGIQLLEGFAQGAEG